MTKIINIFILLVLVVISSAWTGETGNGYVPSSFPKGFELDQSIKFYGTYEKPLKDGTIFNYMNGGGVVYVDNGFQALTHLKLLNKAGDRITLNIFDLTSSDNAGKLFINEDVCPPGFKVVDIGGQAKTYHYEPDYYLYFIKNNYLIYLAVNNDTLSPQLLQMAKEIYKNIK
jgi:hypothetical protein